MGKQIDTEIAVPYLAESGCNYFATFNDDSHCPSAARASKRPAVVSSRWVQRDAFAAAQADYS